MRRFLVLGTYCVPILPNGQSAVLAAESITSAWRSGPQSISWGQWVGPAPRITRGRFDQCIQQVNASWLFEYPDPSQELDGDQSRQYDEVIWNNLRERLTSTLRAASNGNGWDLSLIAYAPNLHGDVDAFWRSGEASRTRTYQSADSGDRENPVGPNDVHPPEVSFLSNAGRWMGENKGILIGVGVLAAFGVSAFVVSKMLDKGIIGGAPPPYGLPPPGPMPGPWMEAPRPPSEYQRPPNEFQRPSAPTASNRQGRPDRSFAKALSRPASSTRGSR